MTIASHVAARESASAPLQVSWSAVGVIVAILVHLGAAVWFAATVSARLHTIEQQLPPGAIATLTAQSSQMQKQIDRLVDAREAAPRE